MKEVGESIVLKLGMDVIEFMGELEPSQLVVILGVALANFVVLVVAGLVFSKIFDIKNDGMSKSMDFSEEIQAEEAGKMIARGCAIVDSRVDSDTHNRDDLKYWQERYDNASAQKAFLTEMAYNVFEDKTSRWIKGRFHRNGFHKLKGEDLIEYKTTMGKKLYRRNLRFFEQKGINQHKFIEIKEPGLLYKESECIEAVGKIIDARIRFVNKQNAEIRKYLFLIKPLLNRIFPAK